VRLPTVAVTFCQPREARINFESALRVGTAHVVSLPDHFIRKTARSMRVSIFQTLQLHVEDTKTGVLLIYVMAIADEVDSQLAQGMKSYISEAKRDARPIEA
jgi:hypothetical protein